MDYVDIDIFVIYSCISQRPEDLQPCQAINKEDYIMNYVDIDICVI